MFLYMLTGAQIAVCKVELVGFFSLAFVRSNTMFSWIQSFTTALQITFHTRLIKYFFWTLHSFSCFSEVQVIKTLLSSVAHNFGLKFFLLWKWCIKAVSNKPVLGFLFAWRFLPGLCRHSVHSCIPTVWCFPSCSCYGVTSNSLCWGQWESLFTGAGLQCKVFPVPFPSHPQLLCFLHLKDEKIQFSFLLYQINRRHWVKHSSLMHAGSKIWAYFIKSAVLIQVWIFAQ